MKEFKQLGSYGLVIKDDSILLIQKNGGPYDGKLDLPGGTIEFGETPEKALVRELKEEVGINVLKYKLIDANSVFFDWLYKKENVMLQVHHTGVFYLIEEYEGIIENEIEITDINNDSKGANFYKIEDLTKNKLSAIALLELEKLNYDIKE